MTAVGKKPGLKRKQNVLNLKMVSINGKKKGMEYKDVRNVKKQFIIHKNG